MNESRMASPARIRDLDIAIIGMAGRFPGAPSVPALWEALVQGRDLITRFPEDQADGKTLYVPAYGVLEDIDRFDASFFGIPDHEAVYMDPQQRIMLETVYEALEDAGYPPETCKGLIGLFCGSDDLAYIWRHYYTAGLAPDEKAKVRLYADSSLSARTSYKLNLQGPSVTLRTACSTSLTAIHMACQSLLAYECDLALAGGVSVQPEQSGYYAVEGTLSPDGYTRPFDVNGQGFVPGSGAGIIVLKRLREAIGDNDQIYAVIKGSAINNDGSRKAGYAAPSVQGEAEAVRAALAAAEADPADIGYIEAHGTGTALGDAVELKALKLVFGERAERPFCAIGSVKSNAGHLNVAAGVTGVIKAALVLRHGLIPPTLHCRQPHPELEGSPFRLNADVLRWERADGPRRAGVSSFGIGGTNVHVVLEEAPDREAGRSDDRPQLLVLSARDRQALGERAERLAQCFEANPDTDLADAAHTLQTGRNAFEHRRFLVCSSTREAAEGLRRDAGRNEAAAEGPAPEVVFLFPGIGGAYERMGLDLYRRSAVFRGELDRCFAILDRLLDAPEPLRDVFARQDEDGEAAGLFAGITHGMALWFSLCYAAARTWMSLGVRPKAMVGHSFGEYAAACVAGIWTLEDALALVVRRARLIETLPEGAMLSVSLTEEELMPLLEPGVSVAAVNGDRRILLSGAADAVRRFVARLEEKGIPSVRLPAGRAGHCDLVEPVLPAFREALEKTAFHAPAIPIVSTLTGSPAADGDMQSPDYWLRQMREPVRFHDALRAVLHHDNLVLLEVGPGQQLSMLARKMADKAKRQDVLPSFDGSKAQKGEWADFLQAVGRLWIRGAEIGWSVLHAGYRPRRISLPTYPFRRKRYWREAGAVSAGPDRPPRETPRPPGSRAEPNGRTRILAETWQQSWVVAREDEADGRVWLLIVSDSARAGAVATELADALKRQGRRVAIAAYGTVGAKQADGRFTVNPDEADDVRRVVAAMREAGGGPDVVVDTALLADRPEGRHAARARNTVRALTETAEAGLARPRLFICGTGLFEPFGEEPEADDFGRLLDELARLRAARKLLRCAVVSTERAEAPEAVARHLLKESRLAGDDAAVAYDRGMRWVRRLREADDPDAEPAAEASVRDVCVVGPRESGLSAVGRLADMEAEIRAVVEELHAAGGVRLLHQYPGLTEAYDRLCLAYAADFLRRSGVPLAGSYPERLLYDIPGVREEFHGYIRLFLRLFGQHGCIRREGGQVTWLKAPGPDERAETLLARYGEQFPEFKPYMELLHHCASHYRDALTGAMPANEVLYPGGDYAFLLGIGERMPETSFKSAYCEGLGRIVRLLAERAPRPIRILEIGAGTGLLTWPLLARLEQIETEYWFTDIGASFLAAARREAQARGIGSMTFAKFDVSRHPAEQGIPTGRFDIVVGLNVVQATEDIERSVGHLHALLAPGGLLAMVQTISGHPIQHMMFGLSPGWWNFEKDPLRGESPLLSPEEWTALLRRRQFRDIRVVAGPGGRVESDAALVLAQRAAEPAADLPDDIFESRCSGIALPVEWPESDEAAAVAERLDRLAERLPAERRVLFYRIMAGGRPAPGAEWLKQRIRRARRRGHVWTLVHLIADADTDGRDIAGRLTAHLPALLRHAEEMPYLELAVPSETDGVTRDACAPDAAEEADRPRFDNDVERELHAIVAEALGHEIGLHDSILEAGMDSLSGLTASAKIRSHFRLEITIRELFEHDTIAKLAGHILRLRESGGVREAVPKAERVERGSRRLEDLIAEL